MRKGLITLAAFAASAVFALAGCGAGGDNGGSQAPPGPGGAQGRDLASGKGREEFLKIVDDDPDTVDVQCTTDYYTVGMNIFDRLLEVAPGSDGTSKLVPSLAESWVISDEGCTYTFKLREGVKFTNGADLTADDVLYTFERLLTYRKSVNQDFVDQIKGAKALENGLATTLEGFEIMGDYVFKITLEEPYAGFLACLSTPAVSIYDRETTEAAGEDFGLVPEKTIGSGPFLLTGWTLGSELVLEANPDYWGGAPKLAGVVLKIVDSAETQRMMFENGELDIMDLDRAPGQMEYFVNSKTYAPHIVSGTRVGTYYYSFNQNIEPFGDVRVRKALQMAIDRQTILDAVYSGQGKLENGIFPTGLIGYNPSLPMIPYDPQAAKALLAQAGYPNGFDMEIAQSSDAGDSGKQMNEIVQAMLGEIGIRVSIREYDSASYLDVRKNGELPMYFSSWSADFNDPDNFIYTFFGTADNTFRRSMNYGDTAAIDRVAAARSIVDDEERIREYQALEEKIIQEDACFIPLFSKRHLFVVNPRVHNFTVSWNGWSGNYYSGVTVGK